MLRAALLVFVCVSTSAIAQVGLSPVCISGVVTPVGGPTICQQGETHRLECTDVFLRSRSFGLDAFNGQNVDIVGFEVGVTCRVIQVVQIFPAAARLEYCGSAVLGCPLKLRLCPGGLGRGAILFSFDSGYLPLGCANSPFGLIEGTLLLGGTIVQIWSGTLGANCGEVTLQIPNDNSLLGAGIRFQVARQDIGPVGPLKLTNALCFRLAPLLPPCAPINC